MANHCHRRGRHGHLPHGLHYRISGLLRLYLLILFIIATLSSLVVFAFTLTSPDSGRPQPGHTYNFYLEDYSGWLKDPVSEDKYWNKISSCIANSKVCAKMGRSLLGSPKFIKMFFLRLPCSTMRSTVLQVTLFLILVRLKGVAGSPFLFSASFLFSSDVLIVSCIESMLAQVESLKFLFSYSSWLLSSRMLKAVTEQSGLI